MLKLSHNKSNNVILQLCFTRLYPRHQHYLTAIMAIITIATISVVIVAFLARVFKQTVTMMTLLLATIILAYIIHHQPPIMIL
ncbi:hypothetical protein BDC45DRAFT_507289 [Circinella umbellata]|nr:hypothetical protein BDC45DRAFT_507289 [Circinella umbellata]